MPYLIPLLLPAILHLGIWLPCPPLVAVSCGFTVFLCCLFVICYLAPKIGIELDFLEGNEPQTVNPTLPGEVVLRTYDLAMLVGFALLLYLPMVLIYLVLIVFRDFIMFPD